MMGMAGVVASASALAASLGLGYRFWAPLRHRRELRREIRRADTQLNELQALVVQAQQERDGLRDRYEHHRQELETRRQQYRQSRVVLNERSREELNHALGEVRRRRDELAAKAGELANKIAVGRQQGTAVAVEIRAEVEQSVACEAERLLRKRQDEHLHLVLESHRIEHLRLPGMGPRFRQSLTEVGILSAAEVTPEALRQVPGVGAKKREALLLWREGLEQQARFSQPLVLSEEDSALLREQFAEDTRELHGIEDNTEAAWIRRRSGLESQQMEALERLAAAEARLKTESETWLRQREARLWHLFRLAASDLVEEGHAMRRSYREANTRCHELLVELQEARRVLDELTRQEARLPRLGFGHFMAAVLMGKAPPKSRFADTATQVPREHRPPASPGMARAA
jgi:chromosome segregation ATPase